MLLLLSDYIVKKQFNLQFFVFQIIRLITKILDI
jgi:hypothetical protein